MPCTFFCKIHQLSSAPYFQIAVPTCTGRAHQKLANSLTSGSIFQLLLSYRPASIGSKHCSQNSQSLVRTSYSISPNHTFQRQTAEWLPILPGPTKLRPTTTRSLLWRKPRFSPTLHSFASHINFISASPSRFSWRRERLRYVRHARGVGHGMAFNIRINCDTELSLRSGLTTCFSEVTIPAAKVAA